MRAWLCQLEATKCAKATPHCAARAKNRHRPRQIGPARELIPMKDVEAGARATGPGRWNAEAVFRKE
jgi:hypothetical protein